MLKICFAQTIYYSILCLKIINEYVFLHHGKLDRRRRLKLCDITGPTLWPGRVLKLRTNSKEMTISGFLNLFLIYMCGRHMIFQTMSYIRWKRLSLKYKRFKPSICGKNLVPLSSIYILNSKYVCFSQTDCQVYNRWQRRICTLSVQLYSDVPSVNSVLFPTKLSIIVIILE